MTNPWKHPLEVSAKVADLAGRAEIGAPQLAEALQYRRRGTL